MNWSRPPPPVSWSSPPSTGELIVGIRPDDLIPKIRSDDFFEVGGDVASSDAPGAHVGHGTGGKIDIYARRCPVKRNRVAAIAAIHDVATEAAVDRIVTIAAAERISTAATRQYVAPTSAGQPVRVVIADEVVVSAPADDMVEVSNRIPGGFANPRKHGNGVGGQDNLYIRRIHAVVQRIGPQAAVERIATEPAAYGVVAIATIDHVGEIIADDDVRLPVSGSVDRVASGQHQLLDVRAEHERHGAADLVRAAACRLDGPIAGIIDNVDVVAFVAHHPVGAPFPVERVGPRIAGDGVVERVARSVAVGGPGQRQLLDVGTERVCDRRFDRVGAAAHRLRHLVAGIVDDVGVVAGATLHDVGALAAVQQIIAVAPDEGVVAREAGQVIIAIEA